MALTLTQTAKITKRGLVLFTILIFLLISAYVSYQIYYTRYYLPSLPPVSEKPTVTFGVLPQPNFPQTAGSTSNYSYSLATTTGGLPTDIPKLAKVYFVPQLGTTLLAPQKAQSLANLLQFPNGPDSVNQTQYTFNDGNGGQLNLDLNSGNFKFQRVASPSANSLQGTALTEASNSGLQIDSILPDSPTIVTNFKGYLNSKGLLSDDLRNGRSKVAYDSDSQSSANTAIVSLWPSDLDSLQIVSPDPNTGLINAQVTKYQDDIHRYPTVNFTYWLPDTKTFSTYPLITPDQALTALKQGQGAVVIEPTNPQVSITSVKLAYFESDQYNPYIEPIYVFEGENFMAYVSAITPDYLSK